MNARKNKVMRKEDGNGTFVLKQNKWSAVGLTKSIFCDGGGFELYICADEADFTTTVQWDQQAQHNSWKMML